jgi:hypothetical protein
MIDVVAIISFITGVSVGIYIVSQLSEWIDKNIKNNGKS